MDTDGSRVTRLTYGGRNVQSPSWAPGGKQIAFSTEDGIVVMNADGSEQTIIVPSDPGNVFATNPQWSDDGKQIAFSRSQLNVQDGAQEIFVVNADVTGVTRLTFIDGGDTVDDWRR
jgi:Tol biopolymer transport system component